MVKSQGYIGNLNDSLPEWFINGTSIKRITALNLMTGTSSLLTILVLCLNNPYYFLLMFLKTPCLNTKCCRPWPDAAFCRVWFQFICLDCLHRSDIPNTYAYHNDRLYYEPQHKFWWVHFLLTRLEDNNQNLTREKEENTKEKDMLDNKVKELEGLNSRWSMSFITSERERERERETYRQTSRVG